MQACAPNLQQIATRRAAREFACAPASLRMRGVGELHVGAPAVHVVELYEASGCDREQLYLCVSETSRCERAINALPWPTLRSAFERALEVLRKAARARCPDSELRVIAESQTLFRYEACDGRWLYHCRARGCDRL